LLNKSSGSNKQRWGTVIRCAAIRLGHRRPGTKFENNNEDRHDQMFGSGDRLSGRCSGLCAGRGSNSLGRDFIFNGLPNCDSTFFHQEYRERRYKVGNLKRDGSYVVRKLQPGTYEITVSARGFSDAHATVAISVDGKPVVNLVMQPASTDGASKGQVGSSTVKGT